MTPHVKQEAVLQQHPKGRPTKTLIYLKTEARGDFKGDDRATARLLSSEIVTKILLSAVFLSFLLCQDGQMTQKSTECEMRVNIRSLKCLEAGSKSSFTSRWLMRDALFLQVSNFSSTSCATFDRILKHKTRNLRYMKSPSYSLNRIQTL